MNASPPNMKPSPISFGLTNATDKAWYASLMLNRLMFVYFIQQKGFLDGNQNYLADRMRRVREQAGEGHFHSFYRQFLRRLFHEGLGQHKGSRGADLSTLIGEVPYLNGGLFAVHELEEAHPDIDIPDEAFERLFAFFDAYDWHLDDRPLSKGSEKYALYDAAGTKGDGATISMPGRAGRGIRRNDACAAAGTASSWTSGVTTTATPGTGAGPGCAKGPVINEFSDASGTGNYVYEFVELHNDR